MYSGGGIEPDRRFDGPIEGFNPDALRPRAVEFEQRRRVRHLCVALRRRRRHARQADADGTEDGQAQFVVDDAMVADFRELLKADRIRVNEDALKKDVRLHHAR